MTTLLYYSSRNKDARILDTSLNHTKEIAERFGWPVVSVTPEQMHNGTISLISTNEGNGAYRAIWGSIKQACEWIIEYRGNQTVFLTEDDCFYSIEHYTQRPQTPRLMYNLNWVYASSIGVFETCNRGSLLLSGLSASADILLQTANDMIDNEQPGFEPTNGAGHYRSTNPSVDMRGSFNTSWTAWVGDNGECVASNQPARWTDERSDIINKAYQLAKEVDG